MGAPPAEPDIAAIVGGIRRIALVGASPKPERPAHDVMRHLLDWGYDVVPVNPGQAGGEILGRTVYAALADIPGPIDTIDLFVASPRAGAIVDQAIALRAEKGVAVVWMQPGIHDEAARARAEAAGLIVVTDRCLKVEAMTTR